MSDEPARKEILLLFTGEHAAREGKHRVGAWTEITTEDLDAERFPIERNGRVYARKIRGSAMSSAQPGMIYRVESDEGGTSIYGATARYAGRWPVPDDVTQWVAEDLARRTCLDAEAKMRSDAKADPLLEALRPIQLAYAQAVGPQKRVLLALVIERITRTPR